MSRGDQVAGLRLAVEPDHRINEHDTMNIVNKNRKHLYQSMYLLYIYIYICLFIDLFIYIYIYI